MTRQRTIHPAYERLIGTAAVDATLRTNLLRDPCAAAITFGLTPDEADIVGNITANNLREFALALLPRLYGPAFTIPSNHVVAI